MLISRKVLPFILVLLCLNVETGWPASAAKTPATAESVAMAYLKASRETNVNEMAALMHPEAIEKFTETLMPAVVEARKAGMEDRIMPMFSGVKSVAELEKMEPKQFYASYIGTTAARYRKIFSKMKFTTIGGLMEGADLYHFVYRMNIDLRKTSATQVSLVSLKRNGNGWGVLLTQDVKNSTKQVRRYITSQALRAGMQK
jgi:hypothetical protein